MIKFPRMVIFLLFLIAALLAGCNLPGSQPQATEAPGLVFTVAAETVDAKVTADQATVETPAGQPTSEPDSPPATPTETPLAATPTPTLSHTPEPTTTPEPTQTPPEAATATPTEIPLVIFEDDFSDQTSWYTDEGDNFGFEYTDEGYRIYNNIVLGVIWSIREQQINDVGIEVSGTRLAGPDDGYFGVVCRFTDDGENYYALVIGDDGFYGIALMEDGEYDFLDSGMDEQGIIHPGEGETNRVRGVCNGSHLSLYANGQLVLDLWDETLESGIIGLAVGNKRSAGGTDILFQDFAVTYP